MRGRLWNCVLMPDASTVPQVPGYGCGVAGC